MKTLEQLDEWTVRKKKPLSMLIMAWDGASPDVIFPNLDRLPHLRRLCLEGSYGIVRSRLSSYDIWITYYTGLLPEKHGFQLKKLRDTRNSPDDPFELHSLRKVNCTHFLWDYINGAGMSIGMFAALGTFPAPAVNGFVISGELLFGPHDLAFYPQEAKVHYQDWSFSYPDPPPLQTIGITKPFASLTSEEVETVLGEPYFDFALDRMESKIVSYQRMLTELNRIYTVDVLFVYFIDLDIIQHFSFHDKNMTTILQAYRMADAALGDYLEEYQPANVLVISDHGVDSFSNILDRKGEGESTPDIFKQLGNGVIVGEASNHGIISGAHTNRAFYALRGPLVQPGRRLDINFINVLPLILGTLKIKIPDHIDGKTPDLFR